MMSLVTSDTIEVMYTPKMLLEKMAVFQYSELMIFEYDTLSNGKVIATGLPGQISQVPVDEDETYLRTNFDQSNNINYRDGDARSSRFFDDFEEDDSDTDASYT